MKYIVIIILLTVNTYAFDNRWTVIDSAKTSKDYYYDLKCADSLNCFVWNLHENNKHTLRRTVNGGYNWDNVYYNNSFNLRSITFPHKDLFIAAGDSMILRTTNQGDSWDTTVFEGYDIYGFGFIKMFDKFHGIASACIGDCMFNSNTIYFQTND